MASFLPDSSCMVAAVLAWHDDHEAAVAEIERRLDRGEEMVVAAHALLEAYAVLTRLPARHRLAPTDAQTALEGSFIASGRVRGLDARECVSLLRRAPADGIAGGQVYDAVIARTAKRAGASALLTFNERHFRRLAPEGVEVVVPAA